MAAKRVAMRKLREIFRLKLLEGCSNRVIAKSTGIGVATVSRVCQRAQLRGLTWEQVQQLDDAELEELIYGGAPASSDRPQPDCAHIHRELRKPGVTLEVLHLEYLQAHPDGLKYTSFCNAYRHWRKRVGLSMRQVHRAGEKLFVDYSGKKPEVVDPDTGEVRQVELFVAVLGASNYTFALATESQTSPDWIYAHTEALHFFGGAPKLLVPDQLRSGVRAPERYEPMAQRTYEELAEHYGTIVLPARPGKPRDKAKVEVGVQVVQRWVLARLRHETFFSLEALNDRIRVLIEELNSRRMRAYGCSRREMFERYEEQELRALPARRFEYAEWKTVKVSIDYHVEVDGHFYSVPHPLVGQKLEARSTTFVVEVLHRGRRVASHRRSYVKGKATTVSAHMPKSHRQHLEWSPSRILRWAGSVGPNTEGLASRILQSRPHPEMGYRSCLGILRLAKTFGHERLEAACLRALNVNATSYRQVNAILKNGLDRLPPVEPPEPEQPPLFNPNVRGPDYYN